MKTISKAAVIYLTLFIVLSMPFALALLPQNFNGTEFSIYNQGWDGLSEFRSLIADSKYNISIKTLMGSANALNRLNQSIGAEAGTLIIMGPKVHYDPFEAIAIMLYALKGGRVVLVDDFGTSNDILNYFSFVINMLSNTVLKDQTTNLFGMPQNASTSSFTQGGSGSCNKSAPFPIIGIAINQSVLVTADPSGYFQSPVQPIFTPPQSSTGGSSSFTLLAPWLTQMVKNVNKVIGNYAATISMKVQFPDNFTDGNGNYIGQSTYYGLTPTQQCGYNVSHYQQIWVPFSEFPASITNFAGMSIPPVNISLKLSALYSSQKSFLDPNVTQATNVNTIQPSSSDWGNVEFPIAIDFPFGQSASSGELMVISDPSIFINQYLSTSAKYNPNFDPTNFDNRQFATNIIDMLFQDRQGTVVYFDEGHLAQSLISPTMYLGSFFRYLDFMTMVPFIAPFLPFLVYGFAKKLAPKGSYGTALLKTKAENYYGRSYFAFKMRWFLENRHFTRGLELIYRRIRRDLMNRYKLDDWSPETAVSHLYTEYPNLRKNLLRKMIEIENVLNQNIMIEEQQFMDLYLVLSEINSHIKM